MIGHAFMGAAHAQAWRTAHRVFDLPARPVMTVVAGRDEQATRAAAQRQGWAGHTTDWRTVLERDDVHVVDVCTPGDTHAEMALAALGAGKHVLCEKPLANTVAEAEQMAAAAREAERHGVWSSVGFSYRRTPALAYARELVARGALGTVRHVRAHYLQDWIVDPAFPLVWRLQKDKAGSGALGDIGAHVVDLAQWLTGQRLTDVAGHLTRFVERRPLAEATSGLRATSGEDDVETGEVTVDDAAVFLGRTDGGALATFEATRFATGRKNAMRIELNGSAGSLAFDFEAMNELDVYDGTVPARDAGFRRVLVTEPDHPYAGAWWPPGHGLGYEHTFVHQVADFVRDVATGTAPSPSFDDGLQVQRVLDAVERSSDAGATWTPV
ncbi:Gfo/Idh/MocA family oxidoreductase [Nocardioides marinquilinus]|uniref:Gfo/Idh/MocA family oxidoreductase n=2 Tax=Nocardioides marinquilinus TaxID=1210400 RepID=A0ABP9PL50_9ACTN